MAQFRFSLCYNPHILFREGAEAWWQSRRFAYRKPRFNPWHLQMVLGKATWESHCQSIQVVLSQINQWSDSKEGTVASYYCVSCQRRRLVTVQIVLTVHEMFNHFLLLSSPVCILLSWEADPSLHENVLNSIFCFYNMQAAAEPTTHLSCLQPDEQGCFFSVINREY